MNILSNASSLLGQLTLEEKASLCLGSDFWHTAPVERLGIPAIMVSDGPHGLRKQPDDGDHVGIAGSVPATCFPTACALGSSWDPRAGAPRRRGARPRGPGAGRGGGARPGHQHQALPAVRAQLRVLLRGPAACPACSARRWSRASRARASAPRSSTSPPTTRRPTGCGSAPTSTSGRCARSTCRLRAGRHPGAAVDGDVRLQQGQRRLRLRSTPGCSPTSCATSGASTAWSSPTGARCTTGSPPWPPAWTWRCRPTSASATPRSSPPSAPVELDEHVLDAAVARVLQLVDRATASPEPPPVVDARRPPRPGPGGGRRVRGAAEERGSSAAAAPGRRGHDRGDRRVRPHPALPGRRQLPGQPDPGRRRPGRAARRRPRRRGGRLRRRVRPRRHRPRRGAGRRGRRPGRPGRGGRGLPRPARRRRVRGVRPQPHGPSGQPDGAAGPARRRQPEPRRGAGQRLGGAARRTGSSMPRRSWSAGCPGRPPAARSPTCCSARPTPRDGWPRRCRCGWRTPRPTSTSPARPGTSATARASSSATAATTPSTARSATRSATACPTPASATPTSPPTSPGARRTATSS